VKKRAAVGLFVVLFCSPALAEDIGVVMALMPNNEAECRYLKLVKRRMEWPAEELTKALEALTACQEKWGKSRTHCMLESNYSQKMLDFSAEAAVEIATAKRILTAKRGKIDCE